MGLLFVSPRVHAACVPQILACGGTENDLSTCAPNSVLVLGSPATEVVCDTELSDDQVADNITVNNALVATYAASLYPVASSCGAATQIVAFDNYMDEVAYTGCVDDLIYNGITNTLTANINGNAASASTVLAATNADNASKPVLLGSATSGNVGVQTDAGIAYNPSTNVLTTTATSAQTATNADNLTNDPTDCAAGKMATAIDRQADLTCTDYDIADGQYRSTDHTINNSNVRVSSLESAVAANTAYFLDATLIFGQSNAGADLTFALDVPASSTLRVAMWTYQNNGTLLTHQILDTDNGAVSVNTAAVVDIVVVLHGTVVTAGTAGVVDFKWAQSTATAANTTLKVGSALRTSFIAGNAARSTP